MKAFTNGMVFKIITTYMYIHVVRVYILITFSNDCLELYINKYMLHALRFDNVRGLRSTPNYMNLHKHNIRYIETKKLFLPTIKLLFSGELLNI